MTRRSPAARLLVLTLAVVAVALLPELGRGGPSAAFIVAGTCWLIGRPRLAPTLKRALLASGVIAALVLPLALDGETTRAAAVAARALACVVVTLALGAALPQQQLAPALRALRTPRNLAEVVAVAVRQLSVIGDEGRRIVLARQLRGATGVVVGVDVIATLLERASSRAARTELAMQLRGYDIEQAARRARLRGDDLPSVALTVAALLATHLIVRWPS